MLTKEIFQFVKSKGVATYNQIDAHIKANCAKLIAGSARYLTACQPCPLPRLHPCCPKRCPQLLLPAPPAPPACPPTCRHRHPVESVEEPVLPTQAAQHLQAAGPRGVSEQLHSRQHGRRPQRAAGNPCRLPSGRVPASAWRSSSSGSWDGCRRCDRCHWQQQRQRWQHHAQGRGIAGGQPSAGSICRRAADARAAEG